MWRDKFFKHQNYINTIQKIAPPPPWTVIVFSGRVGGYQLTLFRKVWYFVNNYFRGGWWLDTPQTYIRGGGRLYWHKLEASRLT